MRARFLTALTLLAFTTGCDEAGRFLNKLDNFNNAEQTYAAVPGVPAYDALDPVTGTPSVDVDAALEALNVDAAEQSAALSGLSLADDAGPAEVSTGAAEVLTENQKAKKAFNSSLYPKEDVEVPNAGGESASLTADEPVNDTVVWKTGQPDSFVISVLKRMPVRDQGARGTCASHAGIGQIEGLILSKNADLDAINLSEQRFYFNSKPDNWATGGDKTKQGSNAGTGLASSSNFAWDEYKYPADWSSTFNIPLESDCPYNNKVGANDLQTPQPASCAAKGVARVTEYSAWQNNQAQELSTAQQIYDFLITKNYPVIASTKLSPNWEDNDGMITLKGSGGAPTTSHASGHAYLIVGARKLDPAKYPDEGGMCFIIRNSWGKGWGVDGLSCMTLAWFNAWRFKNSNPGLALAVQLNTDLLAQVKNEEKEAPADIVEPDPKTKKTDPVAVKEKEKAGSLANKRGTAHVANLLGGSDTTPLALTASDMIVGELLAGNGQTYKILYRVDGETFVLRGLRRSLDDPAKVIFKQTHDLQLALRDNTKLVSNAGGRGDITFGTFDAAAKRVILCAKSYAAVCDLNYDQDSNELLAGLTEAEAKREDPSEPFDWQGFDIKGYAAEISLPGKFSNRVDITRCIQLAW